ncbi:MAG: hypothetical protein IJG77_01980 [Aeriscardovia sp.]|nr:hypothetical protein [Aeriscardovia sp.]
MAISYEYVCCRGQIDFGPVAKAALGISSAVVRLDVLRMSQSTVLVSRY